MNSQGTGHRRMGKDGLLEEGGILPLLARGFNPGHRGKESPEKNTFFKYNSKTFLSPAKSKRLRLDKKSKGNAHATGQSWRDEDREY